jgi:hypothetical protein
VDARFQLARFVVEVPQVVIHEGHEPDVLVGLFHADLLARKDLADIHFPSLIADAAADGDDGRPVVGRIVEFLKALIGPVRLLAFGTLIWDVIDKNRSRFRR